MKQSNQTSESGKVYAMATNRTIALLQQGIIPWRTIWTASGLPRSLVNQKPYRGINVWMLASLGYKQNFFLTLKQLKEFNATVKDGEKAHPVFFTKWMSDESTSNGSSKKPVLRYYSVYNIEQCDGIPLEKIPVAAQVHDPIGIAERIVNEMPHCPPIYFQDGGAFYNQDDDYINMPLLSEFPSDEAFYAAVFRELAYSTGHVSRLNRSVFVSKSETGLQVYSLEQLTADIATCYLLSIAGMQNVKLDIDNGFVDRLIEKLRKDARMIVYASAQAQRAVEFILGPNTEYTKKQEKEGAHE